MATGVKTHKIYASDHVLIDRVTSSIGNSIYFEIGQIMYEYEDNHCGNEPLAKIGERMAALFKSASKNGFNSIVNSIRCSAEKLKEGSDPGLQNFVNMVERITQERSSVVADRVWVPVSMAKAKEWGIPIPGDVVVEGGKPDMTKPNIKKLLSAMWDYHVKATAYFSQKFTQKADGGLEEWWQELLQKESQGLAIEKEQALNRLSQVYSKTRLTAHPKRH